MLPQLLASSPAQTYVEPPLDLLPIGDRSQMGILLLLFRHLRWQKLQYILCKRMSKDVTGITCEK